MSSPAPILVYGKDAKLLATRRMVLETLGGRVDVAVNRSELAGLLEDPEFELLVLCFTISDEERAEALELARCRKQELKVLILRGDGPPTRTLQDDFSIFAGPAKLKVKVLEMLERTPAMR